MHELDIDELLRQTNAVQQAIEATPSIDPWCSSLDWVVPVHLAFAPETRPLLLEGDSGYALLATYTTDEGSTLIAGLEPLWGFASPLLGADQTATARELARHLAADPEWSTLALPGTPAERPLVMSIAAELAILGDVGLSEGITRQVIDLSDGVTAWLQRRSPKFRRNLRNAQRRAREAGLDYEIIDDDAGLFERILAIERTSWKGLQGDGITSPEMTAFYRAMIERLAGERRVRCVIATSRGTDVGYILGGVRGSRYRGLQLSYAEDAASLSLGHLLQLHEIHRSAAAGIDLYDMGMDMPYKQRMADSAVSSVVIVVRRPPTD